jgi:hypothetical protein
VAVQTPTPQSRRAILAAALGAGAATIASAFGRPFAADAANNDPVTVGNVFQGTMTTDIQNFASNNTVFKAESIGDGSFAGDGIGLLGTSFSSVGVRGDSVQGYGVYGTCPGGVGVHGDSSSSNGVEGISSSGVGVFGKTGGVGIEGVFGQAGAGGTGVVGYTGSTPPTPPPDTGIYGRSDTGGAGGRGLTGFCSTGIGLLGQTDTGVGVRAYCGNTTGVGLQVTGKAAFDRSGKLTISAGHSSITKTGIGLSALSFILATLQTNVAGLAVQAVVPNPAGSAFTIYLNKAPTVSVVVAWLAVN